LEDLDKKNCEENTESDLKGAASDQDFEEDLKRFSLRLQQQQI